MTALAVFLLLNSIEAIAQEDQIRYSIKALSRASVDSITLRWAPLNYETWRAGNKFGYIVDRYIILRDGKFAGETTPLRLTPVPLKPIDLNQWEIIAENNDYAAIAAEAIYGNEFNIEAENTSPVITIFNRATEQQNRYSFALFAADYSAEVAKAMGLWLTDKNVKTGEKYLYVIYFTSNDSIPIDTGFVYTGNDEGRPLPKPLIKDAIGSNKMATLSWESPQGRMAYTSFEVHRSQDNGTNYKVLNSAPLINTYQEDNIQDYNFYIDTLTENNKKYIYKIRGISPFGEKGPFSDTVSIAGKDLLAEIPRITRHEPTKNGVELAWEYSAKSEKLIKGFRILRSDKSNEGFLPLTEDQGPEIRTIIDKKPLGTSYYMIVAMGKNGEIAVSYPVMAQPIDSIPPAPPIGFNAIIDTSGKVIMNWKPNTEKDMYGYRVYRANSPEEEFSQITVAPVRDTFLFDRVGIKTLTEKVYYRLMAVDKRQNFSAFSEIFEVARPDVVPPVPPVLKNLYSGNNGITLEWYSSTSSDVVKQSILRKKESEKLWDEIWVIKDTDTSYTDTTAKTGIVYDYTLQSVDDAGLKSNPAQIFSGKRQKTSGSITLTGKAEPSESMVILKWHPVQNDGQYVIYRGKNGEPLQLYSTLPGGSEKFEDKRVSPDDEIIYLVKYISSYNIVFSNNLIIKY